MADAPCPATAMGLPEASLYAQLPPWGSVPHSRPDSSLVLLLGPGGPLQAGALSKVTPPACRQGARYRCGGAWYDYWLSYHVLRGLCRWARCQRRRRP